MGEKPVWPDGDEGILLTDILIENNIQDVFIMIHGGLTEYRKHLEGLCKHENFCFYGWKANEEELEAAEPCTSILQSFSEIQQGMVTKKSFDAPGGMGQKYRTVERMVVTELDPGKKVLIESCVTTKAPYGDKFNVLLRHCLESQDKNLVQMTVRCVIVYHAKINGMIKGMIEKGSREGMQKSQEKAASVLTKFVTIRNVYEEGAREEESSGAVDHEESYGGAFWKDAHCQVGALGSPGACILGTGLIFIVLYSDANHVDLLNNAVVAYGTRTHKYSWHTEKGI